MAIKKQNKKNIGKLFILDLQVKTLIKKKTAMISRGPQLLLNYQFKLENISYFEKINLVQKRVMKEKGSSNKVAKQSIKT